MSPKSSLLRFSIELVVATSAAAYATTYFLPLIAAGLDRGVMSVASVVLMLLVIAPLILWRGTAAIHRAQASASVAGRPNAWAAAAAGAAVLVLGLALTGTAVVWNHSNVVAAARERFEHRVSLLNDTIQTRIEGTAQGLRGASALFAANKGIVNRAMFRAYAESSDLLREPSGVRGIGFIQRVQRAELGRFVAAERADGAPQFSVRTGGSAQDLYVIKYIEPLAKNGPAWGYDVASESRRRAAVEKAASTGLSTLSGPIVLVQDGRRSPGWLYLIPVYRTGSQTATREQREAALLGLVYSPIVVAEVLSGTSAESDRELDFVLFDGDEPGIAESLYDSANPAESETRDLADTGSADRMFGATRTLIVAGRLLTAQFSSTPGFEATIDRQASAIAGIAGALLSLVGAFAAWLLVGGRARALSLAHRMTADLERLAMVARRTTDAVLITDRKSCIVWANAGFTRISGYSLEEAVGRHPGDLLNAEFAGTAEMIRLGEAYRAGNPFRGEIQNRGKHGRAYWLDIEAQPIRNDRGEITGFMSIETEITEQRKLRDEIRRKNEVLHSVIENLPCAVSVFDSDLRLIAHNMQLRTLLELPDELINGPDASFERIVRFNAQRGEYGPGDVDLIVRDKIAQVTPPRPHRFERLRPDGTPIEIRGGPMPGGGFVSTYFDISESRRAEDSLRKNELFMRVITDHLPGRVAYWDRDLRCGFVNQVYVDWLGKPREQLLGRHMSEVIDPKRFTLNSDHIRNALEGKPQRFERNEHTVDGQVATTVVHYIPDVQDCEVRGFFVMTLDVTEVKRSEQKLRDLNLDLSHARDRAEAATRAKSEFLANMSHEIRTPMNAVLGMLKLLLRTELTARQRDYADKTQGAARSLLGLLNDILDFSKVEAGKMTLDPHPFRIDQLMRDLGVVLSASVGTKAIEVLFDLDPALPKSLVGDALRLQQVLVNLGGNAIKFTSHGEVVIALRVVDRQAHELTLDVSVQDTGIGIAPENQSRIFAGFTQAEASTTRKFGGTGLGLAISRHMVSQMGGELKLDSTPGVGSRFHFRVTLPIATDAIELEGETAPAERRAEVAGLRALVVDDNAAARQILCTMIESLGWQVEAADSGSQGIACVDRALQRSGAESAAPFDALFVDWQMPGMDGWQVIERVDQLCATRPRPLMIVVTAYGREMLELRSAEEQARIDGFLCKPLTPSAVFDAVMGGRALRNPATAASRKTTAVADRLQGLRLLLAEDNPNNQQIALELLRDEGAQVAIVDNGELAVSAVRDAVPMFDAVLMDLQMPVMDGYTATAHIRRLHDSDALPIVAMTANVMAADREACLAVGMNDHVGKPLDLDKLVATLLRLTGRTASPRAKPLDDALASALPDGLGRYADEHGIELAAAVARLGGKLPVYQRSLRTFLKDTIEFPAQLESLLQAGDREAAERLLHTQKGLAATLGFSALSQAAAAAEAALRSATFTGSAPVAAVVTALGSARSHAEWILAQLEDSLSAVPVIAASGDIVPLREALRELTELLGNADMGALDAFTRLQTQHAATLNGSLQLLEEAMGSLDFAHGLSLCKQLAAELAPSAQV